MSNLARLLKSHPPANSANRANPSPDISNISEISSGGASQPQPVEPTDQQIATEKRRQRVIAILERSAPTVQRAFEVSYVGDHAIIALALRCAATCEWVLPRAKFDPFLFLQFLQQYEAAH